jgi:hypothetical protein
MKTLPHTISNNQKLKIIQIHILISIFFSKKKIPNYQFPMLLLFDTTMHKGWIWDTQLDTKPESHLA